jgi:hypothetical protein
MPEKTENGNSAEEPEQEEQQETPHHYKPGDMSVLRQLVENELKMTVEEYGDFKEQNIDWQVSGGVHPTQGMKVARIVGNEVSWRLNGDRRTRADEGEHDATTPTGSYLEMLLWMSSVKNMWVATPKFIPVLQ